MQLDDDDKAMLQVVDERTEEVKKVMKLIREEFVPRGSFNADDIYMHKSEPKDLDMYLALGFMAKKGELIETHDPATVMKHTEMTYEVPR